MRAPERVGLWPFLALVSGRRRGAVKVNRERSDHERGRDPGIEERNGLEQAVRQECRCTEEGADDGDAERIPAHREQPEQTSLVVRLGYKCLLSLWTPLPETG
jgi:hypothetical protein